MGITDPEPLDHLSRNGSAFKFHGLIGYAHRPDARLAPLNRKRARHGQPMLHIKARPPEFTDMRSNFHPVVELHGLEKIGLGLDKRQAGNAELCGQVPAGPSGRDG